MTGRPSCRVFWGSHGCDHPRGHPAEIPHECDCCDCGERHPYPRPPYYGPDTVFYGEDAETLGLPLVKDRQPFHPAPAPVTVPLKPLTDLGAPMRVTLPPVPDGATGWRVTGLSEVVVLARMPDGNCVWGRGATGDDAMADARRAWVRWKRGHAGPLAVDGHAYRRRCKARTRRHRR